MAPAYTITDLGPVGNPSNPRYGINNAGDIVGAFLPAGSSSNHPFFRKHGTSTNIDITPGTAGSGVAYTVNASASAVGYFDSGIQRAFIWSESGGLTYLSPSNLAAQAFGLNDGGHAVGVIDDGSGTGGNAFEWDAVSGFHNLTGNGTVSPFYGFGINNLANVVGSTTQAHAFARLNGNYIDLGTLSDLGLQSSAQSISEDNYVVGYSETPSGNANRPHHAFIWFDANSNNQSDLGEMKDLGILPGGTNVASDAYDINTSHQIVGTAELTSGGVRHAVLWHDDDCDGQYSTSEIKDLNTLISDASWILQSAQSINDGGQIVGFGTLSGIPHGFLLTPSSSPPPPCSTPTPSPTPTPATTSLISVQGTGTYGGTATLNATLYSNDMPVFGKTISFTLNSIAVCGASTGVTCPTTNASGVATLSGVSVSGINVGNYPAAVGAIFAGDAGYGSASQNGPLTVTPFLLLESGTNNAAAVDSVTFVRGPFSVMDNFNFSGDHLTRIIVFTSPLANPEPTLKVFASGHELQVESFGSVTGATGLNVSYIVVKLDPVLTGSGPINYDLTVSLRGVTSNTATLTIIP